MATTASSLRIEQHAQPNRNMEVVLFCTLAIMTCPNYVYNWHMYVSNSRLCNSVSPYIQHVKRDTNACVKTHYN